MVKLSLAAASLFLTSSPCVVVASAGTLMSSTKTTTTMVATVDSKGSATVKDSSTRKELYVPAVKSFLTLQIPASLHNPHGEAHRLAHFGLTKTRGSMARYTYFFDDSLCDPEGIFGRNHTYPTRPADQQQMIHPFFLLARDTGGCTPVRMARTAQEFGASALILGEQFCRCHDSDCTDAFPADKKCLEIDPPLVDDGSASDVTIPTVLFHKKKASALYDEIKNKNQPAMMELAWGLPLAAKDIPDDFTGSVDEMFEPHYHLWSSAHDLLLGARAYRHLKILAKAFGHTIHFSPRFAIQSGEQYNCPAHASKSPDQSPCDHLCTNHGRYCAPHAVELSGQAIVRETLRRLCIHRHYPAFVDTVDSNNNKKKKNKEIADINTAYWDYVIHHLDHCSDPHKFGDDGCIEEAYKTAKVDKADIERCMKDTGDVDSDLPNTLLDEQLEKQILSGVVEIPSMVVQNRIHVDQPEARFLFGEICSLFWEATSHPPFMDVQAAAVGFHVPAVCDTCGRCANIMGCLEVGHCIPFEKHSPSSYASDDDGRRKRGGHGWTITFLTLCALGAGGAYFYYKKREEFSLDSRSRNLMDTAYMQLSTGP